jgi:hypothetical protein
MVRKPSANGDQWQHKVKTEDVPLYKLGVPVGHACTPDSTNVNLGLISKEVKRNTKVKWPREINQIIDYHRERNNERLADFRSVDASQNVDAIGGEGR